MSAQPSSSSTASDQNIEAPKKRKRISLSCAECRRLKLRCSRSSWPCTSCVKRGCAELCPNDTLAPTARTTRVAEERNALKDRVAFLESLLQKHGLKDSLPEIALGGIGFQTLPLIKQEPDSDESLLNDEDDDEEESTAPGDTATQNGDSSILVQGVGSLTLREDGTARYLGISAGSAYFADDAQYSSGADEDDEEEGFGDVSRLTTANSSTGDLRSAASSPRGFPFSNSQRVSLDSLRSMLPAQAEAIRLGSNYYQGVSFMFEPLTPADFWGDYLKSVYSRTIIEGPKLACVFMVLALGALFDRQAPATTNRTSIKYFELAQATLSASNFLSHATLPALQAIHLSGNFLFNQHNLQESGERMAVKMAISMGLHRDSAQWGLTEEECNRRRLAFWELLALDRLQALISGRPYSIQSNHFDTLMPTNASMYALTKWRLTGLIARMTDEVFSVKTPTHGQVAAIDCDLRALYQASPATTRCSALPSTAYSSPPARPDPSTQSTSGTSTATLGGIKCAMEQHTLAMFFTESFLYLHKAPFAQALVEYPREPLEAPWAASVSAVLLEAGPFVLRIAKSWCDLDQILGPRWWHIFFHTFAATVAQSSLVIKAPTSMLVPHACEQIDIAVRIFESASKTGAPVSALLPRVNALRVDAVTALQASRSVPVGLYPHASKNDADCPSFDKLGTSTQLSRRHRHASTDSGSTSNSISKSRPSTSASTLDSSTQGAQTQPALSQTSKDFAYASGQVASSLAAFYPRPSPSSERAFVYDTPDVHRVMAHDTREPMPTAIEHTAPSTAALAHDHGIELRIPNAAPMQTSNTPAPASAAPRALVPPFLGRIGYSGALPLQPSVVQTDPHVRLAPEQVHQVQASTRSSDYQYHQASYLPPTSQPVPSTLHFGATPGEVSRAHNNMAQFTPASSNFDLNAEPVAISPGSYMMMDQSMMTPLAQTPWTFWGDLMPPSSHDMQ